MNVSGIVDFSRRLGDHLDAIARLPRPAEATEEDLKTVIKLEAGFRSLMAELEEVTAFIDTLGSGDFTPELEEVATALDGHVFKAMEWALRMDISGRARQEN